MANSSMWAAYETYYRNVLLAQHNNPQLLSLWGENLRDLETQILCHTTGGDPIPGTKKYTAEGEEWGPARWPYNAMKDPSYNNPPITYIIEKRMKGIGTTWWDWKNRRTVRLGFDFDSLIGHGKGTTDDFLRRLADIDVPWIEVIRSTRGLGRHLYICFGEPFPTTINHDEHAALARSFLSVMAKATGIDMEAEKDVCGGVMWIHHDNATKENQGYALLKPATEVLTANDIPPNWRDHLTVVKGDRHKVLVRGYDAEGNLTEGNELDESSQSTYHTPLDDVHKAILNQLEKTGYYTIWIHDHHLAQTHTRALLAVFQDWAAKGHPMKGSFDTIAPGSDPEKPNCFIRPRVDGGWDVFRFGNGTKEHALWDVQGKWTHIAYNSTLPFSNLMESAGGVASTTVDKGYVFSTYPEMRAALDRLGYKVDLPQRCNDGSRTFTLRVREDNKIIVTVSKDRSDKPADFPGWTKAPKGWEKLIVSAEISHSNDDDSFWAKLDEQVRVLKQRGTGAAKSCGGDFCGWVIRDHTGTWIGHGRENIGPYLKSRGYEAVEPIVGGAIFRAWLLVNEPFKPEFPGGRRWNRDAPQYIYEPAKLGIDELPVHPWWDRYLNHVGKELDEYIEQEDWCNDWNIKNGGDYLKAWIACLLRYPQDKLPYLFLHGPQNTGKTMFAEVIRLLVDKGIQDASKALTSDYNGELANCILAVVDEVNINGKDGKNSYNLLKTWTTGLTLAIHAKYQQVYEAINYLHFVQMANEISSCPVFPGDTRITAIYIGPIENHVPKFEFHKHLQEEAPHFMATLMGMHIPDPTSRLRLPCIQTQSKVDAMKAAMTGFHDYIDENYHMIPGTKIPLKKLVDDFHSTLSDEEKLPWSTQRIKSELTTLNIPFGLGPHGHLYVGNLTDNPDLEESTPYVVRNRKLIKKGEENGA